MHRCCADSSPAADAASARTTRQRWPDRGAASPGSGYGLARDSRSGCQAGPIWAHRRAVSTSMAISRLSSTGQGGRMPRERARRRQYSCSISPAGRSGMRRVQHTAKSLRSARGPPDVAAFPVGRGGQPAGEGGGYRGPCPVRSSAAARPCRRRWHRRCAPACGADRPDERGVPLDEGVPGRLSPFSRARHKVIDRTGPARTILLLLPTTGSGNPVLIPHILKIRHKASAVHLVIDLFPPSPGPGTPF